MFTSHPTLLIGPADWEPARMPQAEFERRIGALWQAAPEAGRAIVYGDAAHHAELAYLTNLTPKLEASVAVLARGKAPRLFVGGGPNMLGAARPLTWIADVVPLKDLGEALKTDTGASLLINAGNMPTALRRTVGEAPDAAPRLWELMRHKSPAELAAIRAACDALESAMNAIAAAHRSGKGVTAAVLAGERAANAAGAQDVRTLFSLDRGRTLMPFAGLVEHHIEPLQVYVAIRRFNYWAEGFAAFSAQLTPAAAKASELLQAALAAIRPGVGTRVIAQTLETARGDYQTHPVTERAFAGPVGLTLEERPHTDMPGTFEAGEVYSVKIGLTDGGEQHAIVSAMISPCDDGNKMLWSSGPPTN